MTQIHHQGNNINVFGDLQACVKINAEIYAGKVMSYCLTKYYGVFGVQILTTNIHI